MNRAFRRALRFYHEADPGAGPAGGGVADPAVGGDEAAKFRRLFEKADADAKDLAKRLKTFEDEKTAADTKKAADEAAAAEAAKTAQEKLDERLKGLEDRAKKAEREALVLRVAGEAKLKPEAVDLVAGDDETTIKASVDKLVSLGLVATDAGAAVGGNQPVRAGTVTNPGSQQAAGYAEKIAAAEKSGNVGESIRLKREQAGWAAPTES